MTRIYRASESPRISAVLAWEAQPDHCRAVATLAGGDAADTDVQVGTVMGAATLGAVTAAAVGGGTGNGTVTGAAATAATIVGVYRLTCIATAANGGRFQVVRPDGVRLADALVGTAYTGQIAFTINDGATDFAVGDTFTVAVAAGDGHVVPLNLAAVDGSARAASLALAGAFAPEGGTAPLLVLARGPATVKVSGLIWPDGITTDQKSAALADLADRGIIAI